jgi:glyoxylase-like metal-dependent hydrolase (beta-lactamase superfamily II)
MKQIMPQSVIVSHTHEDHVGGCAVLEPETKVLARPTCHGDLRDPPLINEFFRFVWGQPRPTRDPLALKDTIESGGFAFEVLNLPGHKDDMIGLYERAYGWLFSADAVPLPSKKQIAMAEENIPDTIRTMERIQELDVQLLFDGHHGPIQNPRTHIQKRIDYLKGLQQTVKEMHGQGMSVEEIVTSLNFDAPWYMGLTESRFGFDYLVKSLLFDK